MAKPVRNDGAIEALETLLLLAQRGVDFRAELDQLLDDDPVLFCFQIHDMTALTADDHVASVKPSEGLKTFVATLLARNSEFNPLSSGRIDNIDWDHRRSP